MPTAEHTNHRETTLDVLRGLAVLGMIAAHVIFFTHDGTSLALNNVQRLANTIVLTIFVFVSGAVTSRSLDRYGHTGITHRILRFLHISATIYAAYLVTATVAILTANPSPPQETLLPQLIGAATLLHPPNFTEYIPLFILLPLAGVLLQRFYRLTRGRTAYTILGGIGFYIAGLLLYPVVLPAPWDGIKALLTGGPGLLRFPLLFYFPVYLIGLWWEHRMVSSERKVQKVHWFVLALSAFAAIAGSFITRQYDIPVLSPGVRWPPSIGFLATGVAVSCLILFIVSAVPIESWVKKVYRFIAYLGRDAFDLWMTHLVLLFCYRKFVNAQFSDVPTVLFIYTMLVLASAFLSSVALTNGISLSRIGPLAIAPAQSRRLRKRYGVLAAILAFIIMGSVTYKPTTTIYGNQMPEKSFSVYNQLPLKFTATLSSETFWHIRSGPMVNPIRLTLMAVDSESQKHLAINPATVTINIGKTSISANASNITPEALYYEISPGALSPGRYEVRVTISGIESSVTTNTVDIIISEPLLVAWTFDWEGWDVPDRALTLINDYSRIAGDIPFTHFVSPRMFLDGVMEKSRQDSLKAFLLTRNELGDEIALHVHMHYDLVRAAGVTPRITPHWGFRSVEGYDVPTSAYTTDEFRKIIMFALNRMETEGLPAPVGFRAGGWFINSHQLAVLHDLGLRYDSSGRDKATTGAFMTTPWDLPINTTPYYPDFTNQNVPKSVAGGILEIPNNGVTTYESTTQQLLSRMTAVYNGGILDKPKIIVFTSHPQFSASEFARIPGVLNALLEKSMTSDQGPVIFTTMSKIYTLWKSLL